MKVVVDVPIDDRLASVWKPTPTQDAYFASGAGASNTGFSSAGLPPM